MTKGAVAPWKKWIVPALLVLATGALFYAGYRRRAHGHAGQLLLELKPIQVSQGWGYLILMNHHVYIRQNIIPAIPGMHAFRSREDALAVGQKVYDRLMAGQMPMVTAAEVRAMGVAPDSVVKKADSLSKK